MKKFIDGIFGGKPWFQSMTAWGVVSIATAQAFHGAACDPENMLLSAGVCAGIGKGLTWIGGVLVTLGIRKASNPK